jgi:hypothetical protein
MNNLMFVSLITKFFKLLVLRIFIQFFIEFLNLNIFEQIQILCLIFVFLYFIIKYFFLKFLKQIKLNYNQFIVLYFSKLWIIFFYLFFLVMYVISYYYMFGILDCSDINNNKTKIIGIGGGVLVAGGLGYLYMKPIVAKIIANSQTELLTTLQTNNSNIYLAYDSIYKKRIIPNDIAINNYVFDYNCFSGTLTKQDKIKLAQPLIPYNKDLKELCEFEIDGIFKTPALSYFYSNDVKTMGVINLQEELLKRLEAYKNKYSRLSDRLEETQDAYALSSTEQLELTELIIDGSGIDDLFKIYVNNLIAIGDVSISKALGYDTSVTLVHLQYNKPTDRNFILINDLPLSKDAIVYENLFFSDRYPFCYDVCLILAYCFFSIASLYTSGGNPIPKDYFVGACTRLFSFKKYKISKYEDHNNDAFWHLLRWYDV